VFAVLLLVCCGTSAWMQVRSNQMHEQEVVQGLSRDLAQHIASDTVLMDTKGLMPGAVRDLFSQLMLVNPSVEVYLLDTEGKIVGSAAPEGGYAASGSTWRRSSACSGRRLADSRRRSTQRRRAQGVQRRAAQGRWQTGRVSLCGVTRRRP
jgi:hypothetical protein